MSHLTTQYLSRGMPLKNSDNKHVHVFHLPFLHSSSSPYAWCLVVLFKILCATNDCTLFKCTFLYVSIPAALAPGGPAARPIEKIAPPVWLHGNAYYLSFVFIPCWHGRIQRKKNHEANWFFPSVWPTGFELSKSFIHRVTGRNLFHMPVDFCHHLIGRTLRNVCHCDSA